ncbi:MAG: HAD-IB family phosphatase [Candidatus Thorarchaeota archaeon]|nr:HAD-IB family phosphatase [Candidatus Thorarchaeota archaeon]
MYEDIKVVSFDLDGVLYDGKSASYPVAKAVGLEKEFLAILKHNAENQVSMEAAIIEGAKIWAGIPVRGELDHIIETLPLMKGAEETVATLKEWDYLVGCISSGVSQFFLSPLQKRLNLDFAYSNILSESDGVHDGFVSYIMGGPQKAETIQRYLADNSMRPSNLASIGDGENDIDIFKVSRLSIAFNPDSGRVSEAASLTIRSKDLRSVLPHFIRDI